MSNKKGESIKDLEQNSSRHLHRIHHSLINLFQKYAAHPFAPFLEIKIKGHNIE